MISLANGSHSVSLTPGYQGPSRNEYWMIWADLNNEGEFEDAGENIFDSGSAISGTVNGNLSLPAGALTTRLRVSMKRSAAPGPCESFGRGEVEDYTLEVDGGSARIGLQTMVLQCRFHFIFAEVIPCLCRL